MSKFKKGDKVRCTDSMGRDQFGLVNGIVYTVAAIDREDAIRLEGQPEPWAHLNARFELVTLTNAYTVHDESFSSACVGAYFTISEATEWIQAFGIAGHTYTVRESIERRKFEVVEKVQRELKAK